MPKCKGCGAEIEFIGNMPVDPKRLTVVIRKEDLPVKVIGLWKDSYYVVTSAHESHFSTCPKAAEFRKK